MIVDDKKVAEYFNFGFANLGQCFGKKVENKKQCFDVGNSTFDFLQISEKNALV